LPDWLVHRAAVLPEQPALVQGVRSVTYAGLLSRARAVATFLLDAGIRPGDRVGLLFENAIEFVDAVHGCSLAGAICLPLNLRLNPAELAFQLTDAGAAILLCHGPTRAQATEAAVEALIPRVAVLPLGDSAGDDERFESTHAPGEIHSIIYTSGTTGTPKGAMLTYGNFWASAAASAFNLGVLPGDRWLACMPLFHVGGLSIILRSAIYGTTAVIHERFDELAVNRAVREDGVTLLSVVSAMLQRMLDADDEPFPSSVRAVLVGGGPVAPQLLRRALDRGLPVVQTYGLTEAASQVATLAPVDAVSHVGSAGKPLLTTRLRIDAPAGEAGEIMVQGPTVSPGYWGSPDAGTRAIRDGWLHTGDIGRLDQDGFLYVLDRRDDLIVSGGENVYPAEVEAVLAAHPAVSAAAVVGIPDPEWGHLVAAALVPESDHPVDVAAIRAFARERLAAYKVPRRYLVVGSLPATASGKTQRFAVRGLFAQGLHRSETA